MKIERQCQITFIGKDYIVVYYVDLGDIVRFKRINADIGSEYSGLEIGQLIMLEI
jgi:hypothetical protein